MDRKSQIFAPTISVGGVRKPAKTTNAKPATNDALKSVLSSMKGDVNPTRLKNFSYKTDNSLVTINDATIKSIGKNRKHVAFLISGTPTTVDEKQAIKDLSMDDNLSAVKDELNTL
ncbi:hypothetical protein GINT2_002346 [Glugoides intestinalis]